MSGGARAAGTLGFQRLEVGVREEIHENAVAVVGDGGEEHLEEDAVLLEVARLGGDVLDVPGGEVTAPPRAVVFLLNLVKGGGVVTTTGWERAGGQPSFVARQSREGHEGGGVDAASIGAHDGRTDRWTRRAQKVRESALRVAPSRRESGRGEISPPTRLATHQRSNSVAMRNAPRAAHLDGEHLPL